MEYLNILKTIKCLETYKFKGGINTFEAEEWMHMMDTNFEAMICPDKYKKRVAVYYPQGDARNWWESVERQHGNHITSWDVFQKEFRRKYFPPEARHRLERQFINLTQWDRTVREYEAEFTSLRRYESKRKLISGQKGKQIIEFRDSSQKGISRKRGNDSKSWNGNQGCFYCGEVGHIVRHCVAEQAALAKEHPPLALLEDRPSRKRRNRI
ncbi:PREDICTED: uncharacterized protein LOC106330757 [Brassica oleracea var. oleracea]|uniref:uncharacterized protein LOC106330757 n=1 Tax=Brassica oleracea var. oleracea TaxID=109376 RepID=UPI0006A6ABA8|nr:PREDICTED: uncharacterized protein LOC106330757 [Brassica oleracea var. oleracea]